MTPWRAAVQALFAACVLTLATGADAPAQTRSEPAQPAARAEQREIMVMLKLTPDHFHPDSAYGGDYGDRMTSAARRRLAQQIAHRHGLVLVEDGWPMPLVGLDCFIMRVPDAMPLDAVVAQVSAEPQVVWSQPVQMFKAQGATVQDDDPLLPVQPAAKAWRLADLHKIATGRGVTVAVVDSKIEINHPDLAGQFSAVEDFVIDHPSTAERHGTGVAGVIAAKEDNGVGIVGVAPGVRLMALRACWQGEGGAAATVCDSLSLAKAIQFAIDHNAGVINLSLTGPPDRLLSQLIGVATSRRISVVAAFDPDLPKGGFPASEPGVIPVAIDSLPSFPPGVYGAPGRDVPTTQPGGTWFLVNGSSYAAAHVSGLIALVRERHAPLPRAMLVSIQPLGGKIDACATVMRAAKACDCACDLVAQNGSHGP